MSDLKKLTVRLIDLKVDGLTKTAHKALAKAWSELPDDMLEAAFGDHACVVIRKSAEGEISYGRSEHEHD